MSLRKVFGSVQSTTFLLVRTSPFRSTFKTRFSFGTCSKMTTAVQTSEPDGVTATVTNPESISKDTTTNIDKSTVADAAANLASKLSSHASISHSPKKRRLMESQITDDDSKDDAVAASTMSSRPVLRVKRLSENAKLPVKGSEWAAGWDLMSAHTLSVPARGKALVKTDLALELPLGVYGRIAPRSGLAWKKHIDVGAGVIDADYRGNIGVVLFNHSDEDLEVTPGMRVAQLILERYEWKAVLEEAEELSDSVRGSGGFGSTGLHSQ